MPPSTPKPSSDDAAMRKKKNADAQAAFRARRANYIATLEEAVTNLESVVLQLQESCREAKAETMELRQENGRLRREREKFMNALWQQSRKTTGHPDSHPEEFQSHIQSAYPASVQSNSAPLASPISPTHINHYSDQPLPARYQSNTRDASGHMSNTAAFNHQGTGQEYQNRSPTITFAGPDGEHGSIDVRPTSMQSQRVPKYNYTYVDGHIRDPTWTQNMSQGHIPGNDAIHQDSGSSSHSPGFVESSSSNLTSPEMSYVTRYPVEDQKIPLPNLDTNTPYVFSNSRPLSPSASTTSSSSSTMTSPFQFPFSDGSVPQERSEFNLRRHSTGTGAELTLHGGTAHLSFIGENDRYRMGGGRRANNGSDNQPFPLMPPINTENAAHERENSEGETAPYYHGSHPPARRSTTTSRTSRSPSPGTPPICGTLAVIKAQAFGALRRTRARPKKGSEGAAKAAMEALEARGIGVGMSLSKSHKRPRLDDDDDDDGDFRP